MKFSVVFSSSRRRQPLKTKQTKVIVSMLDYPFTLLQVPLTKDEKASITSSLTMRIPELTHHLKHLQVVINFLSVLPTVEGDNSLSEYMKVTFGREVSYLTEGIKLKHVRDVWLLIKYTQADLLMRKHQVNIYFCLIF